MRYIEPTEKSPTRGSHMRGLVVLLTFTVAALAQDPPVVPGAQTATPVPSGVPLRVALEHRVAIKRVGEPMQGRLVEPVWVFDRMVLPAGSIVEGHIAEIGRVPAGRRLTALLSGNLTPPRDVRAQFDTLVLSDGSRLSLRTSPSNGTAHTVRVRAPGKEQQDRKPAVQSPAAIRAFTAPGKMSRLKSTLIGMLPYHRQAWSAGTLFQSVLQEPLTGVPAGYVEAPPGDSSAVPSGVQEVSARLMTSINSATARKRAPVEAIVTQPLFTAGHSLLIPEGSRLTGEIVETQPARRFHRNGKMLFVFRQITLPAGPAQLIQGQMEGVEANFEAHLAVDSEGATRATSPKTRFIFPAIALAVAGLSLHQDFNSQGVPDQDLGGRAESGAVGLGLIGTLLAQASHSLASSIAFTGAGFSLYSTFIARGQDVFLPQNTLVTISIAARGGDASAGEPVK